MTLHILMTLWEGVHPVKTSIYFTFRFLDYNSLRPEDETACRLNQLLQ